MRNIILILFLSNFASCINPPNVKTGFEGSLLPEFKLLLLDSSSYINTANIKNGKPIVLFYFSPRCPYCRAQTEEIISNINSLKDLQFYIFSTYPFDEIKNYYSRFQLKEFPNIIVGRDYNFFFEGYFRTNQVPFMAIYTKEKQFSQVLIGKVNVNQIKKIALR